MRFVRRFKVPQDLYVAFVNRLIEVGKGTVEQWNHGDNIVIVSFKDEADADLFKIALGLYGEEGKILLELGVEILP